MQTFFTDRFFRQNRRRLATEVAKVNPECGPIVVTANGLLQRNADNSFPFQQDSSFWYLTGISEPDITLVIDGTDEFLIVPGRSASREAFDGTIDAGSLTKTSGVSQVLDDTAGWEKLSDLVQKSGSTATPAAAPAYVDHYGIYTNPARAALAQRIGALKTDTQFVDIRMQLADLRVIKQPEELAALQQAIDVTNDSLAALTEPDRFAQYGNEYEIEADLGREFRFRGASGHAFAPIVAGGKRACTLHNVSNEAPLEANSLVILDVGAEVSHYAADITRTRAYGVPSARQQAVFDAVLAVQSYALTLLKPGADLKTYEQAVEARMGEALLQLGLITELSDDATANHEAIRNYFPHATSHFLGLDVHDVGNYQRPLEAGMVLTCEPGIYISEEGIGVRLEDDVLITEDGNRVLSDKLPKTLM